MRTKEVCQDLELSLVKPKEGCSFRVLDIKIYQGVTMASGDAIPVLLCSSGMK